MPLMPDWVQDVSRFLPFQWAFYFPIEASSATSNEELARGLGAQLLWILIGLAIFRVAWKHAIKRYSAVGADVHTLRVSWLFFKVGVLNELQYRVNFVVQLFQSAIALVVGLLVLALVYSHTDELNGWSQSELLCVLGIQILMGGAIKTSIQPNMMRLIEDVRDGKLDYALTKPEDSQVLEHARGPHLAGRRPRLRLVVLGSGCRGSRPTSGRSTRSPFSRAPSAR